MAHKTPISIATDPHDWFPPLPEVRRSPAPKPDEFITMNWLYEADITNTGGAPWVVPGQIAYTEGTLTDPTAINLPIGLTVGSLLLMLVASSHYFDGFDSAPAGWTYKDALCDSAFGYRVYYRITDGTEGATIPDITWKYASDDHNITVIEIRDALDPISDPFTVTTDDYQTSGATGGPFQVSLITPDHGTCWLYFACYQSTGAAHNIVSYDPQYTHLVDEHDFTVGVGNGTQFLIAKRSIDPNAQAGDLFVTGATSQFALGSIAIPGTLVVGVEDNSIWSYDAYAEIWKPQMWFELGLAEENHHHYGDEGTITLSLDQLADVVIAGVADQELLGYDADTGKWINHTAAEAGLSVVGHDHSGDYISIITLPAANHFPYQTAGGELEDSGYDASDFAADDHDHDADYLGIAAQAADADTVDGQHANEFAAASHALDDHSDVNAAAPNEGDVLTWDDDPGEWIPVAPAGGGGDLEDLGNVVITSVQDDEALVWDSGTSKWVNAAIGPGAAMDNLSDVTLTDLADEDILQYDSGTGEWVNVELPAGGAVALDDVTDVVITSPQQYDLLMYDNGDWINYPMLESMLLDSLYDVTIDGPADNEVLAYDYGTNEWINQTAAEAGLAEASHAHALADLSDVDATAPDADDVLAWDGDSWGPVAPSGGGASELDELDDVTIAVDLADNDLLAYVTDHWENQTLAEAGVAAATHDHDADYMDIGAALADLSDVDADAPSEDDVLTWDGDSWGPAAPAGGGGALDDLSDVVITSPEAGDLIQYSGAVWGNGSFAECGVAAANHIHADQWFFSFTQGVAVTASNTDFLAKGTSIVPSLNTVVYGLAALITDDTAQTYALRIYQFNSVGGTTQVGAALASADVTITANDLTRLYAVKFASPVTLVAGTQYAIVVVNTTAGADYAHTEYQSTYVLDGGDDISGLSARYYRINDAAPANGATWSTATSPANCVGVLMHNA